MTNDPSPEVAEQLEPELETSGAVIGTLKDLDPVEAVSATGDALAILEKELGQE